MGFSLRNQLYMRLSVGGVEIPLDPDLVEKMAIIQNQKNLLPVVQISFFDVLGLSQKSSIFMDGSPVVVEMGPNDGSPLRSHPFRLLTMPKLTPHPKGIYVEVTGYLDHPEYMFKVIDKALPKMPSAGAISAVAGMAGLSAITDATSDVMTWLPDNRKLGQFARFITSHGWAGGSSLMGLAVTEAAGNYHLRYMDLMSRIGQAGKTTFVNDRPSNGGNTFALNHIVKSFSGFLNGIGGYGGQTFQSLQKGDFSKFADISFPGGSGGINMSSAVKSAVGAVRNEFAPFFSGNTHPKFQEAVHQNNRMKATFGSVVHVMTSDQTDLAIFDPVSLNFVNQQTGERDVVYNGNYLVESKTIYVERDHYRELVVVTNQGSGGEGSEG